MEGCSSPSLTPNCPPLVAKVNASPEVVRAFDLAIAIAEEHFKRLQWTALQDPETMARFKNLERAQRDLYLMRAESGKYTPSTDLHQLNLMKAEYAFLQEASKVEGYCQWYRRLIWLRACRDLCAAGVQFPYPIQIHSRSNRSYL